MHTNAGECAFKVFCQDVTFSQFIPRIRASHREGPEAPAVDG